MENEKKKFDKVKYDIEYRKTHYKKFVADLKKEDMRILENYLKKNNMTKKEFIMKAINKIKDK